MDVEEPAGGLLLVGAEQSRLDALGEGQELVPVPAVQPLPLPPLDHPAAAHPRMVSSRRWLAAAPSSPPPPPHSLMP